MQQAVLDQLQLLHAQNACQTLMHPSVAACTWEVQMIVMVHAGVAGVC